MELLAGLTKIIGGVGEVVVKGPSESQTSSTQQ